MFDALSIPLTEGADWIVAGAGSGNQPLDPESFVESNILPDGWKGIPSSDPERGLIAVKQGLVRLIETVPYLWVITGPKAEELTVSDRNFTLPKDGDWTITGLVNEAPRGRFQIVNYLGFADFIFEKQGQPLPVRVEFVSRKLDYDTEYRAMTEDIADFCSQLLLSWNTPTGLQFSADPEKRKRIKLEQFLFLRSFLDDRKFEACLEVIRTRPHSELQKRKDWVPASEARSSDFLSNPMAMSRGWRSFNGGGGNVMKLPTEVVEVSKSDSYNTPPNQFVRFALEQFNQLCLEVAAIYSDATGKPPTQAGLEADHLSSRLTSVLSLPLLKECDRLSRVPLESQVLQKKEGYRDILKAWLQLQSASRFDWEGNAECYMGSSRNVDALYEYWIFLTLHRLLKEIEGVEILPDEETPDEGCEPFISTKDGEVSINLRKGTQSVAKFRYTEGNAEMRLHLYYERQFIPAGNFSWSGKFKPDYTLVMFPASLESEKAAAEKGKLSFLHFDAKYRAEKIGDVFGGWMDEESGDTSGTDEENESESGNRLYKQDDLLKMHTYNDAIRRTAGSYVLYPGEDKAPKPKERFHEILPGVGAFVLKPGNADCEKFLKRFLGDVFRHQTDQFTQFRYVADTIYQAVREEPEPVREEGARYTVTRKSAPCVVHWMKAGDIEVFKEGGFAYCHAVYEEDSQNETRLQLDLAAEIGSEFVPCGGSRGQPRITSGWRAKITSVSFLTNDRLCEWLLNHKGIEKSPSTRRATHYLLFEFDEVSNFPRYDVTEIARKYQSGSRNMAFTCRWADVVTSPRI